MANYMEIGGIPNFNCTGEPSAIAIKWKKWKRAFELFIVGKNVSNQKQKRALLLHCAGMEVQEIFETLEDTGANDDYNTALAKLNEYFEPQLNIPYERHQFRQMSQSENETIDQFVTRLKTKAENCDFGDKRDEHIRDQVVDKCKSNNLRKKFLEKGKELTLSKILDMSRATEAAEKQATSMGNSAAAACQINGVRTKRKGTLHEKQLQNQRPQPRDPCYRCGRRGHQGNDAHCPALGKECNKCKKIGHFAKQCRTRVSRSTPRYNNRTPFSGKRGRINFMENYKDDNDDYAFGINVNSNDECNVNVNIGGVTLRMHIDSGASCNIIDKSTWENLKSKQIKCTSKRVDKKLFAYGTKQPIRTIGTFITNVNLGENTQKDVEFVVMNGEGIPLLGKETAVKLGVLKVGTDINQVSETNIFTKYPEQFKGLGKLKNHQVKIHVNPDVKPVAQAVRRIPFSMRDKLEQKLDELEELDVIEKVSGPSSWMSPVVVVPKPSGDIRLCVDMRQANNAIVRERFPIPTIDEVLHKMNGSKMFSKLDLKWGYHQLELEENSRDVTTFVTHKGLYRYKRLMFGISSAPEIYQHTIQQILQCCEGTHNISDDIIIYGKDQQEHDKRLEAVIKRLGECGLTVKKDKCHLRLPKVEFMGHVLSENGIEPTDEKVIAVRDARRPENCSEVRSFLGLVNFSGKFVKNLASLSEPLRKLKRKHEPFVWKREQEDSFKKLKDALVNAKALGYFDKYAKTRIIADASPVGLGAVLVQAQNGEQRVCYYASRSLSDVEKRYSQTEKEALALVWACEKFHLYLYGIEFELVTDHKPLEFIYSTKSKPSARIERWVLRLQPYKFKVVYRPGPENVADALSRLLVKTLPENRNIAEEYVRFVAINCTPHAMNIKEIERESDNDEELKVVRHCIESGNWAGTSLSFQAIKNELCVLGKLVMRGTKIVIPSRLRERVLKIAHEGHQGIMKTKQRLRTKVWWPKIDKDAEKLCKACHPCQLVSAPSFPEPMMRKTLPDKPWQHLAIDLMGPFPSGEHILVVVDYFSRYMEVVVLKSTTSSKIIASLDEIFARFGLPRTIRTDNGSQFISDEFKEFMKANDIRHETSPPLWPQANGEVERQNRTLLKAIRAAQTEGKQWRKELLTFLVAYRSTPHSTTRVTPAELMFQREMRTKLPAVIEKTRTIDNDLDEIRERDFAMKTKGKDYSDKKRHAKNSDIEVGDKVLLQQQKQNKLSSTFESEPYEVVNREGGELTIQSKQGVKYKRNSSHLRKYVETKENSPIEQPDSDDRHAPQQCGNSDDELTHTEIETRSDETRSRVPRVRKQPEKLKDYVTV